jgi:hypothetical protein
LYKPIRIEVAVFKLISKVAHQVLISTSFELLNSFERRNELLENMRLTIDWIITEVGWLKNIKPGDYNKAYQIMIVCCVSKKSAIQALFTERGKQNHCTAVNILRDATILNEGSTARIHRICATIKTK